MNRSGQGWSDTRLFLQKLSKLCITTLQHYKVVMETFPQMLEGEIVRYKLMDSC